MSILIFRKSFDKEHDTFAYAIVKQDEKVITRGTWERPIQDSFHILGCNTTFYSASGPAFGYYKGCFESRDQMSIWLKGHGTNYDHYVLNVEEEYCVVFEKAVLMLNQMYSNNKLEIEDVIWE